MTSPSDAQPRPDSGGHGRRSGRPSLLDDLLGDLAAESTRLRTTVTGLAAPGWRAATPAVGWDVATQIAHLAWTDEAAVLAARAALGDTREWDALALRALDDPENLVDDEAVAGAQAAPAELLARWDAARRAFAEAMRSVGGRMPWFGPAMSPGSMVTARLMETWAHALDVNAALGVQSEPTDRVRHVCHLGVCARDFAYRVHELGPPMEEFRIELVAPSGGVWTWGRYGAAQGVRGPAYDFARLVTQRVHRDDTALVAVGADAEHWLAIAQAFAGPAGAGRAKVGRPHGTRRAGNSR